MLIIIWSILVWMSPNFVCWFTLLKLTSHIIVIAMKTNLGGNYEFLCYQNVCVHTMAGHSVNTTARVLNHISLERAGHQHCDNVCEVCITSLGVELCIKMCDTGGNVCEYYHILVHILLNIAAIQIPHTLLECWWPALSKDIQLNTLASMLTLSQPGL